MNRIALVRCWNEEATIIACLMSIENVFTHIVIIHSDITDSSLELIEAYSKGRSNIIIEKYPYHVYPALDDIYGTGSYDTKNSLAAYYNFGLNICQRIGGAICKIDCDQVYIEASLSAQFESLESSQVSTNQSYGAGLWGINSFVYNNTLLIVGDEILNGLGDAYIYSNSFCLEYYQSPFYEIPKYLVSVKTLAYHNSPSWFHFRRKVQRISNLIKEAFTLEDFVEKGNKIAHLDNDSIELFEQNIRPLLIKSNSPYSGVVFHNDSDTSSEIVYNNF